MTKMAKLFFALRLKDGPGDQTLIYSDAMASRDGC